MREKFAAYVAEHDLISSDDRVLVGVSGGIDSMTLLDLIYKLLGRDRLAVAHCNFTLRGGESDAEQALVERRCAELGVNCHTIRFETRKECEASGESTQMAARRLRYAWFDELCEEFGYTKIAIAHHSDDSIETFFINLMRGTGIRGLTGINVSRERIIRPLLFTSRWDIERYAIDESIPYLTDSSNLGDDYLRGRLRHDILPKFHSASASFGRVMSENIERLSAAQRFIDGQIAMISKSMFSGNRLEIQQLEQFGEPQFVLYEMLRPYGFSGEVVADILSATHTGKRFYAERYIATLDRGALLLTERSVEGFCERVIDENDPAIEWVDPSALSTLQTPSHVALIAADALQFPLRVRRWQQGDWFVPLGMHSQKKVSDYLIDAKVALPDKEQQGVLLSGESIVWLVGHRIDDRYRITERTVRAIRITL